MENIKQTTVVNLWGGPGCGKSTTAAELFAALKKRNISCELVREYVKNWAWRGERVGQWDDVYLFAKQLRAESAVYGRVDWVITNSPLGLGAVYASMYGADDDLMLKLAQQMRVRHARRGIRQIDLMLRREKPYSAAGRYENEEQARRVDTICRAVCWRIGGDFVEVSTAADALEVLGLGV